MKGERRMTWKLDDSRPIYTQIIEHIQMDIIAGRYKPGDKLPSVRDFAMEAAVNPNTMQKALSELERSGLVYSQRTSGRFITDDASAISNLREQLARLQLEQFLEKMKQLGYTWDETIQLMKSISREEE